MRSQNILRRSGGADIKLKHKFSFYLKLIVSICAGLLFCLLLYYLVDTIWNGAVLDWFDKNYMHTRSTVLNETGQEGFIREPNWYQLKNLMLRVLSFTVSLWILSVYLISRMYA